MYHLLTVPGAPRRTRPVSRVPAPVNEQPGEPEEEAAFEPEEGQPIEAEVTYPIGEPVVPEKGEPTVIVIETLPVPADDQPEEHAPEDAPRPLSSSSPHRSPLAPIGWTLAGFGIILALVLVGTQVLPWWTPVAIVTIVPVTRPLRTTMTVHLVTGSADPTHDEVGGRHLASLTMSQQQTVTTTGNGYQPAQAAHGWITLYNALDTPQTIPAGTLLTGQDGTQVTTDTTVTIPAGQFARNGQARVSAHAVASGPAGNIVAQDIHGPCCRADVLAENLAPFAGGVDAQSYQAVRAQDIQGIATTLATTLLHQVSVAYQGELANGESLVTPLACTPQITSDHPPSSEATHVTVTVAEACQGMAYQAAQLHTLVIQAMNQQAQESQAGTFQLDSASLSVQVIASSTHPGDLHIKADGMLVAQWNTQQQDALALLIAGKSETQATALLLQQPGVSTVSMHLTGRDTGRLPDDPGRIQFAFWVADF